MKSKKLQFCIAFLMVICVTNVFAQAGTPSTCGTVTPYYNAGTGWVNIDTTNGDNLNLNMVAGSDIIVGINPTGDATYVITVNSTQIYSGSATDYTVANPVPNVNDTAVVVVQYTDTCGTYTYTWNLTGLGCVPLTAEAITPYYNAGSGWANATENTVPGEINVLSTDGTITFGPQPTSGSYTWEWTGACVAGLSATDVREPTYTIGSESCALTAKATLDDGCGGTEVVSYTFNIIVDGQSLGIEKFEQAGFSMYPNPVNDNLIINFNGDLEVDILNTSGQKVISQSINSEGVINVSGLPSGLYIAKLTSDNDFIARKFIKK